MPDIIATPTIPRPRLLVLQVAALGWNVLERHGSSRSLPSRLTARPATGLFPALTCPVQATLRTALPPGQHGMLANGFFDPALKKAFFWEQSAALITGDRIWNPFRRGGGRVGLWFWQQSLGESVDEVLSPAPIHRHHGGMIDTCFSRPADLYPQLCQAVGRRFRLRHYWGPTASTAASQWIADALCRQLASSEVPDLMFAYLPGLDYDLQRHGPAGPWAARALRRTEEQITQIAETAFRHRFDIVVFGDYAITPCRHGAIFPNRCLRDGGWLATREVQGRSYADLAHSRAFSLVDHAVAHVHVEQPGDLAAVRAALESLDGIEHVWGREEQARRGLWHPGRSGALLLVAAEGRWLAYPWWDRDRRAPDYANHVDIHNKPGFDPTELFWNRFPFSVGGDPHRIGGTHGRTGPGHEVVLAASDSTLALSDDLLTLAENLRNHLSYDLPHPPTPDAQPYAANP